MNRAVRVAFLIAMALLSQACFALGAPFNPANSCEVGVSMSAEAVPGALRWTLTATRLPGATWSNCIARLEFPAAERTPTNYQSLPYYPYDVSFLDHTFMTLTEDAGREECRDLDESNDPNYPKRHKACDAELAIGESRRVVLMSAGAVPPPHRYCLIAGVKALNVTEVGAELLPERSMSNNIAGQCADVYRAHDIHQGVIIESAPATTFVYRADIEVFGGNYTDVAGETVSTDVELPQSFEYHAAYGDGWTCAPKSPSNVRVVTCSRIAQARELFPVLTVVGFKEN